MVDFLLTALVGALALTLYGLIQRGVRRTASPLKRSPDDDGKAQDYGESSRADGSGRPSADVFGFVAGVNYGKHYAEFLEGLENGDEVIAELLLFRGWTTQFGYRLFSSDAAASEALVGEVVNQSKYVAKELLFAVSDGDIEESLGGGFIGLLDGRWQEYDRVFIEYRDVDPPIPTRRICSKVTDFCGVQHPLKFIWLCQDFIRHLEAVKAEALNSGLVGSHSVRAYGA